MEIPDNLLTLYTATVSESDGRFVLEVPTDEITRGLVTEGGTYRVAILEREVRRTSDPKSENEANSDGAGDETEDLSPPVSVGETRTVTIEDLGSKGDGIARVERGYVIIIPDADVGDEVKIKITETRDNVGFGTIIE